MDKENCGLSSQNTGFLVFLVAAVLLVFGPIQPYGLVVRTVYLIAIPTSLWFALAHWRKRWRIDALTNDRVNRMLCSVVAGALLVGSYQAYTAKHHFECDQLVQTDDGTDCVGDYVRVKGGDIEEAFIMALIAATMIWVAVAKRD